MYDIITIGSALVDVFISSGCFEVQQQAQGLMLCQKLGEKLEIESLQVITGGGGSNTAVGFSRMGLKVALISETGQDTLAHLVKDNLVKSGVTTSLLIQEKKEQTGGSAILVCKGGERTVLVHRGAASMLDPHDISPFHLSKTNWVHLSSIAGRENTLHKIFSLLKKNETPSSWNPGSKELKLLNTKKLKVADVVCRVLFLNKEEWQMLKNVQEELLSSIPEIIITDGKKGGSVYLKGKKKFDFPALSKDSIDNTGAGDSFAVGYISAKLSKKDQEVAAKWGAINAGSVVRFMGAKKGLLTKDQIGKRLKL